MWMCAKHKEEQAAESLHFTVLQYFEMATDGITYDPKVNYTEMVEVRQCASCRKTRVLYYSAVPVPFFTLHRRTNC